VQSAAPLRSSEPENPPSRQSRKPPPTGLTLSDNALVGLYFIQRYRFLTVAQFGRAARLKRSFSAELLRSLETRGFLGYFGNVGMQGRGKTPKVYYLTRKGYELLRRESDIPDELLGTFKETFVEAKWSPQTYHRLHLVDLLIALEAAVRTREHLSLTNTWLEYRRIKRLGPHTAATIAAQVEGPHWRTGLVMLPAALRQRQYHFKIDNQDNGV
jgi:DNA-binding PadR family transcriptional regulator